MPMSQATLTPKKARWTPSKLRSQMYAWYSADVGVFSDSSRTTPSTNGGYVAGWTDRSGNGHHMTQPNGDTYKPTYASAGLNGKGTVSFDGVADYLVGTNSDAWNAWHVTGNFELVCVLNKHVSTAARSPFGQTITSTEKGLDGWFNANNTYQLIVCRGGGATSVNKTTTATLANGSWKAIGFYGDTANAYISLDNLANYESGAFTAFTTGNATRAMSLGGCSVAGDISQKLDCSIAEMLVFSTALSAGNRALLKAYLIAKWGLT